MAKVHGQTGNESHWICLFRISTISVDSSSVAYTQISNVVYDYMKEYVFLFCLHFHCLFAGAMLAT